MKCFHCAKTDIVPSVARLFEGDRRKCFFNSHKRFGRAHPEPSPWACRRDRRVLAHGPGRRSL